MSADTAKENASVVDSSVTEKHEIGDEPGMNIETQVICYVVVFFHTLATSPV